MLNPKNNMTLKMFEYFLSNQIIEEENENYDEDQQEMEMYIKRINETDIEGYEIDYGGRILIDNWNTRKIANKNYQGVKKVIFKI